MNTYRIRAEQVVTYEFEVEAETIEDAIASVEDDEQTDMHEVGSSGFIVTVYTLPGQIGWNQRTTEGQL